MIPNELDTLRAAAKRDDRVAVMASVERLDVAFERHRLGSQRFDTIAALLDQRIDDSNHDTKNGYREAVIELEQQRIELERSTLAYVQGEDSSAALIESVDAVTEAYRMYRERTVSLETTVSDASTSPLLVLWGDPVIEVPKGATVNAELSLATVGRSHPDSIAVNVESEMTANRTSLTVEGLNANEIHTICIELGSSTAGEFDVFATATGEMNVDRFRFTALVLAKREYITRASRLVGSLETMLDSMEEPKRRNRLKNQARILQRRLEAVNDLKDGRQPVRSIDNRLNAAQNSTEAMKRQLASVGPTMQRQEVLYLLENISEEIDSAIEALS